ncbi:conserved hypothetical protein [Theileria equi strain WA]|uniref:Uncharacterized protein n=1 Tax=Theileria equi strain WA TaxID=1537102 RepID=L1LBQ5_THEEQ|nr:conserved hypothetical protein [Theileria equi strain WA]EKX72862.1 conserved hypothetical protein [Theileria equi strain WA]|eukprot:XP_004832314.1 conserved hypothetical protein [Theileria equi strain WA]
MGICRKGLKRIKRLALYAKRSPIEAELDRFWGLPPVNSPVAKKKKIKRPKPAVVDTKPSLDNINFDVVTQKAPEVQKPEPKVERRKGNGPDPELAKEKKFFKDAVKDLRTLVYPHLNPIAKKRFDEIKLMALGGKVAKNRKMPIKEYVQRKNAMKRHIEKDKKLEKELGVKFIVDTKGGARSAELEKKKIQREIRSRKSLFDFGDRNGIYRIRP